MVGKEYPESHGSGQEKGAKPQQGGLHGAMHGFLAWASLRPGDPWWEVALHAIVRIVLIVVQEFQRDAITRRASALTFTVVLSLVPTLALGTAVLKGLGAGGASVDRPDDGHGVRSP